MSGHHPEKPIPRPILIGIATLLVLSLILVGVARLTGFKVGVADPSDTLAQRDLIFVDQPDGAIAVITAGDRQEIERLAPGTNAFIRGSLHALARGHRDGAATKGEAVFRLTRWADGRLTLDDLATGAHMELDAYGPTNTLEFARLLPVNEPRP